MLTIDQEKHMASFKIQKFSGIRPRFPESLLPDGSATVAQNCDFGYGELRNTKDGFGLFTMENEPRSIYTDEGLTFYTWAADVSGVRSPIVNDQFTRMYYTGQGEFRVANRLGTKPTGGPPSNSYKVGVPRPTVKPALVVEEPVSLSEATAKLTWTFHWEYGGVKYQEQEIRPTAANSTQYTYTSPSKTSETPDQAFPVMRLTAKALSDDAQLCDIYTENSSFDGTGGLYSLSMAKDTTGSAYTITLTVGIREEDKETRAYVYTYVNSYNEEGPPSDPQLVITSPVIEVSVTVTKDATPGFAPINEIRIYRTPTGSSIAQYFYVGTIAVAGDPGQFSFRDQVTAEQLNEPLASLNYYPPSQNLRGLMALPNGILMAWKDNELHFSEAYKPWAWPPAYVKPLQNAVVGGIAHGTGALVTTTAQPYLVSGVSPDSMTTARINVDQAGVSRRSIAVADGIVIYASNDGLVAVSGGSAGLVQSQRFFTREVWRTRYGAHLSSMQFSVWDGRLIVFSTSAGFTPFMIRFDEADGTMTELPNFVAQCAFTSVLSDQMYYARGNTLYQFNGGLNLTATWQSKEMVAPRPVNFGAAQVVCEGEWTMELWAYNKATNGYVLRHTKTMGSGSHDLRLPSGYESDRYLVKLSGIGRFRELRVAQTFRELSVL